MTSNKRQVIPYVLTKNTSLCQSEYHYH